jgi:osmotically-inducible protein OsmY
VKLVLGGAIVVNADQVREHIIRHLKWDDSLRGSDIKVDFVEGRAILTGNVPSLVAHNAAQRDALSIPGVDRVENRLTVKFIHEHPNKSDKELESDVQKVLECTVASDRDRIEVSVSDGIVILRGNAGSYWRKARIEDLASSVDGVLEIKNEIQVTPSEKAPDGAIKKEILEALNRMDVDGINAINVKVKNGIVTLSGSVPTWSTAFDIEDTARYTSGVIEVKNVLSVE